MQLRKFRIRLGKIHHIFISHLHGDHTFGLFGLISSLNILGREESLHIFGPEGLEEMMLDHLKFFHNDLDFDLIFHKIQCRRSARIFEDKYTEVISLPLIHRVPTCGFLFREKPRERNIRKEVIEEYKIPVRDIARIKQGEDFTTPDGQQILNHDLTLAPYRARSYAYCSDSRPNEKNLPLLTDVDLLFHEATFAHEDLDLAQKTYHTTTVQAADFAKKAGAGQLLIGHFSSRYKDISMLEQQARAIFPATVAVNDGDVFNIEQVRMPE